MCKGAGSDNHRGLWFFGMSSSHLARFFRRSLLKNPEHARNPLRPLEAYNVRIAAQERMEDTTRGQARALNQQHMTGSLTWLVTSNGDQTLHAVIAEQRKLKRANEIPAEHAEELEPTTIAEARACAHADFWWGL